MNPFAEEELEQALIRNEKTKKFPELIDLHLKWSELLDDEDTKLVISEHDFFKRYEKISVMNYRGKSYELYQSLINERIYILGRFTDPNEYDQNKRRFQCVWNNMFTH